MTMAEILALEPFRDASIIGGAAGLDRRVEHVTVIEVPEPSRWGSTAALVVSTLYSCQHRSNQIDLIARLARRNAGGLVVHPAGPAEVYYSDMASVAGRLAFPIVRVHPDVPYLRIFEAIYGELLNRQACLLRASQDLYDRFAQLVVSGQDLRAIASALHDIVGNPVLVVGAEFSKRLTWGGSFDLAQQLARLIQSPEVVDLLSACSEGMEAVSVYQVPWSGQDRERRSEVTVYVAPIRPGGKLARYLVVADMCKPVDEVGLSAIRHAATVVAFDVLRERAVLESERRMTAGLLDELLSGDAMSLDALVSRADVLGMDLRNRRLVLFVGLTGQRGLSGPDSGSFQPAIDGVRTEVLLRGTEVLLHVTEAAVRHLDPSAIVAGRADGVVVLPSFHGDQSRSSGMTKASQLAEKLVDRLSQRVDRAVLHVGMGVMVDGPCDLRWSYETARWAVSMARRTDRGSGVVAYDALGFYQLAAAGTLNESLLDRFVSESLSALVQGSSLDQNERMRTLEAFLDCRESFVAAAEKLFVHPNTVKYRMEKIRKILPVEALSDADRRLTLHLALKLRRLRP